MDGDDVKNARAIAVQVYGHPAMDLGGRRALIRASMAVRRQSIDVVLGCGTRHRFVSEDLPLRTTPCGCGDQNCYAVVWRSDGYPFPGDHLKQEA
jgi:hypothetical protein